MLPRIIPPPSAFEDSKLTQLTWGQTPTKKSAIKPHVKPQLKLMTSRCPCASETLPPVYGSYGSYYNPHLLPHKPNKPHSQSKPHVRRVRKSKLEALEKLNLPDAPPPYTGPYNVMWNPKVRRGPTLVHFTTLERKKCSDFKAFRDRLKNVNSRNLRRDNLEDTQFSTHSRGISGGGSYYPNVDIPPKKELTDFSQFLVEQEDDSFGKYADFTSQTEPAAPITEQVFAESQTKAHGVRNDWRSGLEVGVQGDWTHIQATPTINARQETINQVSEFMASQVLCQSLLETAECEELEVLRGQCESIRHWLAVEQRKRFQEKRALCKKLAKRKYEEELEMEAELEMKEAEGRVGVALFSRGFINTLIDRGFKEFIHLGLLGTNTDKGKDTEALANSKASLSVQKTMEWLHDKAVVYFKNKVVARDILESAIGDAVEKRCEDFVMDLFQEAAEGLSELSPSDLEQRLNELGLGGENDQVLNEADGKVNSLEEVKPEQVPGADDYNDDDLDVEENDDDNLPLDDNVDNVDDKAEAETNVKEIIPLMKPNPRFSLDD